MINEFQKRATEHLRDDEAFLAIVSPEPAEFFLASHGSSGALYERLAVIRGTPGSGKTTLARLFGLSSIATLLEREDHSDYGPIIKTLSACGAIGEGRPQILACRLPMEADYREFWEFSYSEELRTGLMTSLIQSRAVLGWLRAAQRLGAGLDDIQLIAKTDAEAALKAIGGTSVTELAERAREVEQAVYAVTNALVPPPTDNISPAATRAYQPFDVIERLRVSTERFGTLDLVPTVMLDDAHSLHPEQYQLLERWLMRRELRVGRWILARLDILEPKAAIEAITDQQSPRLTLPGVDPRRERIEILLQPTGSERTSSRPKFRGIAKAMATRYLARMKMFSDRGFRRLQDLLSETPAELGAGKLQTLRRRTEREIAAAELSKSRIAELRGVVAAYGKGRVYTEAISLAMLRVVVARYKNRTRGQRALFAPEETTTEVVAANRDVELGAQMLLLHEFQLPYYFGIDMLCDASTENAEQFLRLTAALIEQCSTKLIRDKSPTLTAEEQHLILVATATAAFDGWSFPYASYVQRIVRDIAERCVSESLKPGAYLGPGANAVGVPQEQFEELVRSDCVTTKVLQFAVAYNCIVLVPRYECKGRTWCLLELGGIPCLRHGLTLRRGGFVQGRVDELVRLVDDNKGA